MVGEWLEFSLWEIADYINGRPTKPSELCEQGDAFHNDRFPDLKADYILANPPFNMKECGGERLRDVVGWNCSMPQGHSASLVRAGYIVSHRTKHLIVRRTDESRLYCPLS